MRLLTVIVGTLVLATSAPAASLQARLIRAINSPDQKAEALTDILPELKKKFGFNRFELISARQAALPDGERVRLDLGEGFVLFAAGRPGKKPRADIEWYAGKVSLVKAKDIKGTLLIKGPAVGHEWIILALTVAE